MSPAPRTAMQMGSNTDVHRLGLTVHVQTEDHGLGSMRMTTQVFVSGAIVDSRTISYADDVAGLESPSERDGQIRKLMKAMHKHFITRVTSGSYDERLPLKPPASVDIPVDDLVAGAVPVAAAEVSAWRGTPVPVLVVEQALSEAIIDALRSR